MVNDSSGVGSMCFLIRQFNKMQKLDEDIEELLHNYLEELSYEELLRDTLNSYQKRRKKYQPVKLVTFKTLEGKSNPHPSNLSNVG